jgi:predicted nucleic acid-binding protein
VRRYVLDASVAFKWFVKARDETLIEEAARLLELYLTTEVQFYVPDLFFAEFANILWKAERLGRCDRKTADAALAEIVNRNLPTFPTSVLLKPAAGIARAYSRTIYDSLYLALASELDAPFLTADVKLVNSFRGQLPVLWLGAL